MLIIVSALLVVCIFFLNKRLYYFDGSVHARNVTVISFKLLLLVGVAFPALYQLLFIKESLFLILWNRGGGASAEGLALMCKAFMICLALLIGLVFVNVFFPGKSAYLWILFIFAICISIYFRLLFIQGHSQELYSDFLIMWNEAKLRLARAVGPPVTVQQQRALPFLLPLFYLFGNSAEWVYELGNVIALTISGMIGACIIWKSYSFSMAILYFILVSVVPETYFASLITSHDISGVLYLFLSMGWFFLGFRAFESKRFLVSILSALAMGCTLLLLEIQRGISQVFFVVLFLWLFMYVLESAELASMKYAFFKFLEQHRKRLLLLIFLLICCPYLLFATGFRLIEGKYSISKESIMNIQAPYFAWLGTSRSDGTMDQYAFFLINYWKKLTNDEHVPFLRKMIISDLFYNYSSRVQNYFFRTRRLFNLGSQTDYYFGRLQNRPPHEGKAIGQVYRFAADLFKNVYLLFLFIASLYIFFKKWTKHEIYFPVFFVSIVAISMALFAENQPRFLFMGWYLWPFLFIECIDSFLNKKAQKAPKEGFFFKPTEVLFSTLISFFLFLFALTVFVIANSFIDFKFLDLSRFISVFPSERVVHSNKNPMLLVLDPNQLEENSQKEIWSEYFFKAHQGKVYSLSGFLRMAQYKKNVPFQRAYKFKVFIDDYLLYEQVISESKVNNKSLRFLLSSIKPNSEILKVRFVLEVSSQCDILTKDEPVFNIEYLSLELET